MKTLDLIRELLEMHRAHGNLEVEISVPEYNDESDAIAKVTFQTGEPGFDGGFGVAKPIPPKIVIKS